MGAALRDSDGKLSLTTRIMIAMGAGLVLGVILNIAGIEAINTHLVGGFFGMVGRMFVNALQMLVVPLVFFSLICGVAGIGDIRILGRVGGKSFGLYMATTGTAIAVAILIALLVSPGDGFVMEGIDTSGVTGREAPSVWETFAAIVPRNPVAAFSGGEMLQIIF